ncbi:DUF2911 domain-containing protein [Leptobacterium sp. I13]|uniref:DUF2911 domain-containing protein n=1 Tax=Leptobacterium meishanense TaxID=3128904 RepID=UPI0030ED7C2B
MNKTVKWAIIIVLILGVGVFGLFKYMQTQTKKHSPEETVTFNQGETELSITYSRPYKKGRDIFGGLIPYGQVWRTGANEATVFKTNKDLSIGDKTLKAGKYTLWTIPNENEWAVIFNDKMYGWGVGYGGVPSRNPEYDAVTINVPVETLPTFLEQFTIAFEENEDVYLTFSWDQTKVKVPILK